MQWSIDPSHTSVEFAVKHMGFFTVRGRFRNVRGLVEDDGQGGLRRIEASIEAASIDTADPKRDEHLRSADFFDTRRHPVITFQSSAVEQRGQGRYRVNGALTIRDQTRPVALEVELTPAMTDPWGNRRAGGSATGRLVRRDWGLTWNTVLEAGTLLVGEEVRFTIEAQAVATTSVAA